MMLPFRVETGCLKCHRQQGYKLGDIRGGISTSIPLVPLHALEQGQQIGIALSHAAIWMIGLTILAYYQRHLEQVVMRHTAELQTRAMELEAANKDLQGFSYAVSHDLRSPLRAIDGYSAILREDYAPHLDAEGLRLLTVVGDGARKMGQLIDDILAFSRAGSYQVHLTHLDMHALVGEVWEGLAGQRGDRPIEFRLGALPPACGDRAILCLIWQNLLENALKFSRQRVPAVIEVSGEQRDGEILYSVQDNGVGFNNAYVNKLFVIFQRLHGMDEFPGTGVGLALVKRYIQKHGGWVEADGQMGVSATFRFSLPADPGC